LTPRGERRIVPGAEESVKPERRRSPRVRAPEGAEGLIRSTLQVQVEDVSKDGVRFRLSGPIRPGSTYAFHASLEGLDLAAPIRITRCKAIPPAKGAGRGIVYEAGAEFVWEKPADEERVVSWLAVRGAAAGRIRAELEG